MKSQCLVVILLVFIATGVQCGSLFNEEMESEQPPCCKDENLLSCVKIGLNASALGDEELEIETLQETLVFKGMVGDSQTSYHYSNDEAEMVITYHANTGGAYGHISLDNGESFVIEYCGAHGHVMKELDVQNLGEDYGDDVEEDGTESRKLLDNRQGNACAVENFYRYFQYRYIGRMGQSTCRARCTTTSGCIGWVNNDRYGSCYLYGARYRSWTGMSVGPSYGSSSCSYDTSSCTDSDSIMSARYSGSRWISSAEACEQACIASSSCQFWRWYRNRCYMWRTNYRSRSGWTSGPRFCRKG